MGMRESDRAARPSGAEIPDGPQAAGQEGRCQVGTNIGARARPGKQAAGSPDFESSQSEECADAAATSAM